MNPICTYFGYLFINFCMSADTSPSTESTVALQDYTNQNSKGFHTEYQWYQVNFTWPSPTSYKSYLHKKLYVPENAAITGIKVHKDQVFLALPQLRKGVPVTLGTMTLSETLPILDPPIKPFPSWEMNIQNGDCGSLQSVYAVEIDKNGLLWVLDGYRANNYTKCPPKLVLFDLNSANKIMLFHIFPMDVASSQGGFLSDLVVDNSDGDYAYITDQNPADPGLIVYSRKQNRAWKVRDSTMFPEYEASDFKINNVTFKKMAPIDGIALSPPHSKTGNKLLFYCSLTGMNLYSLKTKVLKNEHLIKSGEWRRGLELVGKKQGQSGSLTMDNTGTLYYTVLPQNGVAKWNINSPFDTAEMIEKGDGNMGWGDSFAFDDRGNLRVLSNNFHKIVDEKERFSVRPYKKVKREIQLRILRMRTGTKSYLYY